MSDTSGERRWRTQAKLELGYWYIPSRERRQTGKKADHIGGDSINNIQRRLMAGKEISDENLEETRLLAQDLFEAKIQIVEIMAQLDPLLLS